VTSRRRHPDRDSPASRRQCDGFIETRFDLPALTDRDANAEPMLDLFDFSHPALLNPPTLPAVTVDPAQLQQCRADFPQMLY